MGPRKARLRLRVERDVHQVDDCARSTLQDQGGSVPRRRCKSLAFRRPPPDTRLAGPRPLDGGALDLQVGIDMKLSLTFDHLCHASQIVAADHAAVQHIFQYSDKYGECSAAVPGPCSFRMAFCVHRTFDEQRRRASPCRKLSKSLCLVNGPSDLSHHLRSAPIPFDSLGRMRWRYNQIRYILERRCFTNRDGVLELLLKLAARCC